MVLFLLSVIEFEQPVILSYFYFGQVFQSLTNVVAEQFNVNLPQHNI